MRGVFSIADLSLNERLYIDVKKYYKKKIKRKKSPIDHPTLV